MHIAQSRIIINIIYSQNVNLDNLYWVLHPLCVSLYLLVFELGGDVFRNGKYYCFGGKKFKVAYIFICLLLYEVSVLINI